MKAKVLFNAHLLPLPEISPAIFVLGNMQVWDQGLIAKAFPRLLLLFFPLPLSRLNYRQLGCVRGSKANPPPHQIALEECIQIWHPHIVPLKALRVH